MKVITNRPSVKINEMEVEYPLTNGLVVSVIDLHNKQYREIMKMFGIVPSKDKDFSVELIRKIGEARGVVELAQEMTFNELVNYCNKKESECKDGEK